MQAERENIIAKTKKYQEDIFGKRYTSASMARIHFPVDVLEKIMKWCKSNKNMLIILGAPGTGKTYFCAALTMWSLNCHESRRYCNETKFLAYLREAIDKGHDFVHRLKEIIDNELFIFDDLGSQAPNEWRTGVIFDLIDERYSSLRPTVITSNLTKSEIMDQYGERIASRLFSKANTVIEMHDGFDLRQSEIEK